jgi:hypothetical protein
MLEERSMKEALNVLLPDLLPPDIRTILIPHSGKSDLDKSVPRKLRAWKTPGVSFVIFRDCGSADCRDVKKKLVAMCEEAGHPDSLVRIVCPHLEAWFLGDLSAVADAFEVPGVLKQESKAKFREPDALANASDELRRLVPAYQKISGARAIAEHMDVEANKSASFRAFVAGVRRIAGPS